MLVIGLVALFMGFYFLYDGAIGYPATQHIQLEYLWIKEQHQNEYQQHWVELAQTNGWSIEDPGPPMSTWDIYTQYIIAAVLLPVGLIVLTFFLLNLRKWVEMDEHGLRDHTRRGIPWDQIQSMDKTRWKTKGIAVVSFQHDGRQRRLVLEDWKYDRKPIDRIVDRIDQQLGEGRE